MVDEREDRTTEDQTEEQWEYKVKVEVEDGGQEDGPGPKAKLTDSIDTLVDEVNKVVRVAIINSKATAESIGDNIRETVSVARGNRDNVVMVRVDDDSLAKLDELLDAGIVNSRSEAAAMLITEGVKAKQGLFDRITAKVEEIRKAKEELRRMVEDEPQ
jgi:hypothetical protein